MLDQLSVLKMVTERLERAGVRYMITGSIAAGHYGRPRMTRDIDIVVEVRPEDARRLLTAVGEEFAGDEKSVTDAIRRRAMFNLIHETAIVKVDFVVRKDDAYRVEEFARRRVVRLDDQDVWMVAPEDLVLSKLVWAKDSRSEIQMRDVKAVLQSQRLVLDWVYLERWAAVLTVQSMLGHLK